MGQKPIVSIILETGTRDLNDLIPFEKAVRAFLNEARRTFKNSEFEMIFVGCGIPRSKLTGKNCFYLDRCDMGYAGWKNEGAKRAKGKYLVFWDADCRPGRGYLKAAVERMESDPEIWGLCGMSNYSGTTYLSRLHNAVNLGYLHVQGARPFTTQSVVLHNLFIRKDRFPREPFGPYWGRVGGDEFITRFAWQFGHPFRSDSRMRIFHEDQDLSYSWPGFLEREVRGLFQFFVWKVVKSELAALFFAIRSIPMLFVRRAQKLSLYGQAMGLGAAEIGFGFVVLASYAALDFFSILVLAFWRPFMRKCLVFFYGRNPLDPRWSPLFPSSVKLKERVFPFETISALLKRNF